MDFTRLSHNSFSTTSLSKNVCAEALDGRPCRRDDCDGCGRAIDGLVEEGGDGKGDELELAVADGLAEEGGDGKGDELELAVVEAPPGDNLGNGDVDGDPLAFVVASSTTRCLLRSPASTLPAVSAC